MRRETQAKQHSRRRVANDTESGEEIEIPSDSESGSDSDSTSSSRSSASGVTNGGAARRPYKSTKTDTTKQAMQLALDQALKENRELKLEKADLKRKAKEAKQRNNGASNSGSKRKSDRTNKQLSNDDRIALIGKKFFVMNEPFVPPNAFMFDKITSIDVANPARYKDDETSLAVLQREIWETTPEDLRGLLKATAHFRDVFRGKGGPVAVYATNTDRSEIPECLRFFKRPGTPKFSKYAPVIFPDGKEDMDKIFHTLHLALIAKAMFGKTSIEFDENGKAKKPKGPPTVGVLWNVTETTPGLVATAAVLAVFYNSPDTEFKAEGNKTKINYQRPFNLYKQIILRGFRDTPAKQQQYRDLFCWYNSIVFADQLPSSLIEPTEEGYKSSDVERAFRGGSDSNHSAHEAGYGEMGDRSKDFDDWDVLSLVNSNRKAGNRRNSPSRSNAATVANITPADPSAPPSGSENLEDNGDLATPDDRAETKECEPKKTRKRKGKAKEVPSRQQKPDPKAARLARELAQLAISEPQVHAAEEASTSRRSTRRARGVQGVNGSGGQRAVTALAPWNLGRKLCGYVNFLIEFCT
ncbi:hypothetical protein EST38_g8707 [Candolleomyces aberdarensis]|uniref:Uncharacterized protein n=1 Tax=Candolleomyces aberdarensis TaxID=2316362 RepID=A0A4Q2DF31_9AGAR|nr:hypothetical protein EST38_g8707 [Candolleomyces aberdarensis]